MFFRKQKEMQGLINATRKSLLNAETKITERNKLIEYQSKDIKELKLKTIELQTVLEEIKNIASSNTYNNEKLSLRKIKELVSDYQSTN
jgi:predicted RNase H-like nuclease